MAITAFLAEAEGNTDNDPDDDDDDDGKNVWMRRQTWRRITTTMRFKGTRKKFITVARAENNQQHAWRWTYS